MKRFLPLAMLLAGFSPFMAEHPRVDRGNRALTEGDPATALGEYQEAERELGGRAEIDYDRGNAYYRQEKFAEAKEAYAKALSGPDALKPREYYNMGNALAHLGSTEEAIAAYRRALALDPNQEDARYNLEVMLRRKSAGMNSPPKDQQPQNKQNPDGGTPGGGQDGGNPDAGPDGGQDAGPPDAGQDRGEDAGAPDAGRDGGMDGGPDAGQSPDAGGPNDERDAGSDRRDSGGSLDAGGRSERDTGRQDEPPGEGGAESRDGGDQPDGSAEGRPPDVSRQNAERLLDALRAREKNWPITPAQKQRARRRHVEKDW